MKSNLKCSVSFFRYSEGFVSIIHHSDDFAVQAQANVLIALGKETFVDVTPTYSSADDKVLALPFAQRNCINSQEEQYLYYRQPACILDCLKEEVYKRCQCHPYYLPKASIFKDLEKYHRDCRINDTMCFVENYCKIWVKMTVQSAKWFSWVFSWFQES